MRNRLATMLDSVVERAGERADALLKRRMQARRSADLSVASALAAEDAQGLQFPLVYLNLLQEWIRDASPAIQVIKPLAEASDPAGLRFRTMIDQCARRLPAAPMRLVREVGLYADELLARTEAVETPSWAGDVGLHFQLASSLGSKGRLLHALLRFTRPQAYLELGTAYGMSALIAARSLQSLGPDRTVTTIEAMEQQHALASTMLRARVGAGIDCRLGWSGQALAALAAEGRSFDFMLHDAAHSYNAYVADFSSAEPMLRPGAVCLIDDIRWDDPRFVGDNAARCYEGWREIAAHPRVRVAVEFDGELGAVLLS